MKNCVWTLHDLGCLGVKRQQSTSQTIFSKTKQKWGEGFSFCSMFSESAGLPEKNPLYRQMSRIDYGFCQHLGRLARTVGALFGGNAAFDDDEIRSVSQTESVLRRKRREIPDYTELAEKGQGCESVSQRTYYERRGKRLPTAQIIRRRERNVSPYYRERTTRGEEADFLLHQT